MHGHFDVPLRYGIKISTEPQRDPDNKVHGANMGPIWGRQDPGGPHVGPMNLAIWGVFDSCISKLLLWHLCNAYTNICWWLKDRRFATQNIILTHRSLDLDDGGICLHLRRFCWIKMHRNLSDFLIYHHMINLVKFHLFSWPCPQMVKCVGDRPWHLQCISNGDITVLYLANRIYI